MTASHSCSTWLLYALNRPTLQWDSALPGGLALQMPQATITMLTATSASSLLALKEQ